ncbi:DUF4167 domain-containing protein [Candidatus Liberibacter sp.]|uniref:DUF4167 domain-containing protein n=1 Tax=Candidatus Liberibacter sp. TaxID=34022 RepID=UPI0015F421FA|nr:DUF4167 domain-containing protein [Candidatus Liberibacter sp.]MBA5723829.1 DUF4167 domain-containing protein [Candidatus Liberibacter sp.]
MRSGQQYKRGRGRDSSSNNGNFNRKNLNPLMRNYDSSGIDVKVRGTAQHIAERYTSLARDAISAGDYVMAENHFQHAEHYNRIIATAHGQIQEKVQRDAQDIPPVKEENGRMEDFSGGLSSQPVIPDGQKMVFGENGSQPPAEGISFERASPEIMETAVKRVRRPLRSRGPRSPRSFNHNRSVEEKSESSSDKNPPAVSIETE